MKTLTNIVTEFIFYWKISPKFGPGDVEKKIGLLLKN